MTSRAHDAGARFVVGLAGSLAILVVLLDPVDGRAACHPTTDPDKADIANARLAVVANCNCTGAANHRAYVSCAARQAKGRLTNKSCLRFVKKCAAHSTCGKPNAVTCCITRGDGAACKVKKDAAPCPGTQGPA